MSEYKTVRKNDRNRSLRRRDSDTRTNRSDNRSNYRSDSRSNSRSDSRTNKRLEPCDAICAKCGKNCKVPFKPTENKPVYCSTCFGNNEKIPQRNQDNNQLDKINYKLDKILDLLNDQKSRNKR